MNSFLVYVALFHFQFIIFCMKKKIKWLAYLIFISLFSIIWGTTIATLFLFSGALKTEISFFYITYNLFSNLRTNILRFLVI